MLLMFNLQETAEVVGALEDPWFFKFFSYPLPPFFRGLKEERVFVTTWVGIRKLVYSSDSRG